MDAEQMGSLLMEDTYKEEHSAAESKSPVVYLWIGLLFLLLFFVRPNEFITNLNTLLLTFSTDRWKGGNYSTLYLRCYIYRRYNLLLKSLYADWSLPSIDISYVSIDATWWFRIYLPLTYILVIASFSQGVSIPAKVRREASSLFRWLTWRKSVAGFQVLFTSSQTAAVFPSTRPFISIISELAWGAALLELSLHNINAAYCPYFSTFHGFRRV